MKRSISVMACLAMASLVIACGTGPAAPSVGTTPSAPVSTASGLPGTPAPTATAIASETTGPSASASPAATTPAPTGVAPGGLIWTRIDAGPGFEDAFAYGLAIQPGMMVAIGEHRLPENQFASVAWYSADGEVWSEATLPEATDDALGRAVLNGVAPLGDGFVAVGSKGDPFEPDGFVWTSADGQVWSEVDPPANNSGIDDVIQTSDGIAAVGRDQSFDGNATLWQSDDATTWQASTIAEFQFPRSVARTGDGGFLVWAKDNNAIDFLFRSEDGEAWDPVSLPAEGENVSSLTSRGDGFLMSTFADDFTQYTVWTSDDGIEWDPALTGTSGFTVGTGGIGYVAINGQSLWTSSDGVTWSEGDHSPFADADARAITSIDDGGVLAAGSTGSQADHHLVLWVGRPAPDS